MTGRISELHLRTLSSFTFVVFNLMPDLVVHASISYTSPIHEFIDRQTEHQCRHGPLWPNKAFVALAVRATYIKVPSSSTKFSVQPVANDLHKPKRTLFTWRRHAAHAGSRFRHWANLA